MTEVTNKPKEAARAKTPKAPRTIVHVTAETIQRSIDLDGRAKSHICAVAEAVKLAAPSARNVSVDIQTIRYSDPEKGLRYVYMTPRAAQLALIKFDQGEIPEPFTFKFQSTNAQVCRIRRAPIALMGKAPSKIVKNIPSKAELRVSSGENSSRSTVRKTGGQPPPQMRTTRRFGLRAFVGGGFIDKSDISEVSTKLDEPSSGATE
jgi:hypothetical protein